MHASTVIAALSAAAPVLAGDVLHSKRMAKRFIDDDGHFNMCT